MSKSHVFFTLTQHIKMPLSSSATSLLSIDLPICLAPMGGVADGKLAGAVAAEGCLGFLSGGYNKEWVEREVKVAQEIVDAKREKKKGALGIGFITWCVLKSDPRFVTLGDTQFRCVGCSLHYRKQCKTLSSTPPSPLLTSRPSIFLLATTLVTST